jgi:hypothetical protein
LTDVELTEAAVTLAVEVERLRAQLRSEADIEAEVIARQAGLTGLTVEDGAAVLELVAPREIIIAWVHAARAWLGDAPNYAETPAEFPREGSGVSMEVKAAGEGDRYVFTLQRAGKLTPHEARRQAEAEVERLRRNIEEAAGRFFSAGTHKYEDGWLDAVHYAQYGELPNGGG